MKVYCKDCFYWQDVFISAMSESIIDQDCVKVFAIKDTPEEGKEIHGYDFPSEYGKKVNVQNDCGMYKNRIIEKERIKKERIEKRKVLCAERKAWWKRNRVGNG